MSKATKKTTQRKGAKPGRRRGEAPVSEPRPLSLSDLEVPVEPLLDREQEWRAGRRVQAALRRVARLLPRHPLGYRRFLARMGEVCAGGGLMFTWMSLREHMAKDLQTATEALRKAERLAPKRRRQAEQALEKGVGVLATYPLDPETLFHWATEVVRVPVEDDPLWKLPRCRKVARVLGRAVEILERERNKLVLPNFRLVLKDVFRYHPTGMRHSDLFQEGVLGLHKAVFRFNPERKTRFSTYATYWIRQSIRKALIDKSRMIRVPQAVQEELRKDEPVLDPDEADRVRRIMSETMLFSAGESDDDDRSSFVVSDSTRSSMDEALHTNVIPDKVAKALEDLDTRSREVLQRRFGLGGDQPQTLEEIGKLMSLSRERIRQIEREALRRMRDIPGLQEAYEDLGSASPVGASRN